MSHFTVLVIGDDWEGQLAPYDENITVEPYKDECYCYNKEKGARPDCDECHGTGTRMSTYNPRSKWDWYSLGGRWKGTFKLKEGKQGAMGRSGVFDNEAKYDCDQARKGDIDFEGMLRDDRKRLVTHWEELQEQLKNADEKKRGQILYLAGFNEPDDPAITDLDLYVAQRAGLTCRALVKDGQWHQRGEMGWWGMSSGDKPLSEWQQEVRKLISELPDDVLLSMVDCHI